MSAKWKKYEKLYVKVKGSVYLLLVGGTQREDSSKPLKHSIVKRILEFFLSIYPLEIFHLFGFPS